MSDVVRYWRVDFRADGTVESVTEVTGPHETEWVIVAAVDEEEAGRKALNVYSRRKKRERIRQLHAEGRCRCSRAQDRPGLLTCSVCSERRKADHENRRARGFPLDIKRDEAARVESFQARSRDRKGEIRLEVLIEVRSQWMNNPTVGAFGAWLHREIRTLAGVDASKEAAA